MSGIEEKGKLCAVLGEIPEGSWWFVVEQSQHTPMGKMNGQNHSLLIDSCKNLQNRR